MDSASLWNEVVTHKDRLLFFSLLSHMLFYIKKGFIFSCKENRLVKDKYFQLAENTIYRIILIYCNLGVIFKMCSYVFYLFRLGKRTILQHLTSENIDNVEYYFKNEIRLTSINPTVGKCIPFVISFVWLNWKFDCLTACVFCPLSHIFWAMCYCILTLNHHSVFVAIYRIHKNKLMNCNEQTGSFIKAYL